MTQEQNEAAELLAWCAWIRRPEGPLMQKLKASREEMMKNSKKGKGKGTGKKRY